MGITIFVLVITFFFGGQPEMRHTRGSFDASISLRWRPKAAHLRCLSRSIVKI